MKDGALRRARIIEALVSVVHERGYAGASVSAVTARAKVSRRTFYEAFDGLEDCFLAFLGEADVRVSALISRAFEGEESWVDGVRVALAALLELLDTEPALAQVLLVEAAAAGPWARERREQHILALTAMIEGYWGAPVEAHSSRLVTAGVMASLLGVLHTQLVTARQEPLIALLGPLMGLVLVPYLDRREVMQEIRRAEALARELLEGYGSGQDRPAPVGVEIPDLLLHPRARRARACVLHLAEHPEASNRQVARAIGIDCHTQISKLLTRLAGLGLVSRGPSEPGRPNAWSLTRDGSRVARALTDTWHGREPGSTSADG
ncbi:MAG TPA: TetR/AcrR family transcriptional regulator [Solirubrobacteraceae bacterium]|nr:TetR/AcrR family transcriptional regulator [Solirubrobacteraceae bacterium]